MYGNNVVVRGCQESKERGEREVGSAGEGGTVGTVCM